MVLLSWYFAQILISRRLWASIELTPQNSVATLPRGVPASFKRRTASPAAMDSRTEETIPTDDATTIASFPFDDTGADLILRSSDGVHFYVHKALLSLASPVFKDMFNIGQAPQTLQDGIPVVQMSEYSHVLHKLLVWCDPRSITLPGQFTFLDISRVLSLTDKFMMEGVTSRVAMLLTKHVDMLPAHVYALAHRGRGSWGDELMRAAAWQTLKSDFPHHTRVFDDISAKALMRLYEYRVDCIMATQSLISNTRWIPREKPWQHRDTEVSMVGPCSCISLECNGGRSWVAKWFVSYLARAADALKEKPCHEAIFLDLDDNGIEVGGEQVAHTPYISVACSARDLNDSATRTAFSLFQQEFADKIDRVTKEVRLIID